VQYVIVDGQSMEPTLHSGDLILIRESTEYEVGDIVSFETPIGMVIHRVIEGSNAEGYVTQGDNNQVIDPWRSDPNTIAGEAWIRIPGGIHLRWISPLLMGLGFLGILGLALRRLTTEDTQIEAPSH
jgi:signal peptidase